MTLPADEVRQLVYTVWRRINRIIRPLSRPEFRPIGDQWSPWVSIRTLKAAYLAHM